MIEQNRLMPHLKKISRLKYFEKREPQKFRELEDRIRDEKELFNGENLTKFVSLYLYFSFLFYFMRKIIEGKRGNERLTHFFFFVTFSFLSFLFYREEVAELMHDEFTLKIVRETKDAQKLLDEEAKNSYALPTGGVDEKGREQTGDKKMEALSRYSHSFVFLFIIYFIVIVVDVVRHYYYLFIGSTFL